MHGGGGSVSLYMGTRQLVCNCLYLCFLSPMTLLACWLAGLLGCGRRSSNSRPASLFPWVHLLYLFSLPQKDDTIAEAVETVHESVKVLLEIAEEAEVPEAVESARNMLKRLVTWNQQGCVQGLARVLWVNEVVVIRIQ